MKPQSRPPIAHALAVLCGLIGGLTLSASALAQADPMAEMRQELARLKARVAQLEAQQAATAASTAPRMTEGVSVEEFNRIATKVEAAEDNMDSNGTKGLKISGMMDPTFISSRNRHSSGFLFLSNFDGDNRSGPDDGYAYDNSYFGAAMIDVQKETENGQRWRLTLAPHKSAGSGYNIASTVHEASLSLPLDGPSTRLIAGQLPDWSGYEYYWSNQQPLISHNLLFDYTIPSFYTGAGLELTRDKWLIKAMLANVNAVRPRAATLEQAGQTAPGLVFRVDYAKGEFSGFGVAGLKLNENGRNTHSLEIDGYFIRGDLTLQGQLGAGAAEGKAWDGTKARWQALSALVGWRLTPRLQVVLRGDVVQSPGAWVPGSAEDGRNGFGRPFAYDADAGEWARNGTQGVKRSALSLGLNYLISANLTSNSGLWNTGTWWKLELRQDRANGPVFLDDRLGDYKRGNTTLLSSIVYAF
ncbi:MAG: hypothetical protein RIQ97_2681 [Pseudomonadota bacterium]